MPRKPRLVIENQPHHIIQRGNNGQRIFIDNADYLFYLSTLKEACLKCQCQLHAYVLMDNHVHLLVSPTQTTGISDLMHYVGCVYVRYFNDAHQRTGTLWEGRFKSVLIDSEQYLLTCYCYIELNPVRAQMVTHPKQYQWSSYRCNGQGDDADLITPHSLYLDIDDNKSERLKFYQELIQRGLDSTIAEAIRVATYKGTVLGDQKFIDKIGKQTHRIIKFFPRGGDRRSGKFKNHQSKSLTSWLTEKRWWNQ